VTVYCAGNQRQRRWPSLRPQRSNVRVLDQSFEPMRGDSARNPTGQCCGQGRLLGGQTMHALSSQISTVNPFGGCGAGLDLGTNSTGFQSEIDWCSDEYEAGRRPQFGEKISTRPFGELPGRKMPRKLQDVAPVREVVALVQTGKARGL
jgi:hypothetical protein